MQTSKSKTLLSLRADVGFGQQFNQEMDQDNQLIWANVNQLSIQMIDLIKAATLSERNELRRDAQNALIQLRAEQPSKFFLQAVGVLHAKELGSNIRQAAGALLARSVITAVPSGWIWDTISITTKNSLKEAILSTLIDPDRIIRRAAANLVASICSIELPRNEWPNIINQIANSSRMEDFAVKEISIVMLGFICERLKLQQSFTLPLHAQETILSSLIVGLSSQNQQIVRAALKALADSFSSTKAIFKNPQHVEFLVQQIVSILNAKTENDLTLKLLTEFAKCNYNEIAPFVPGIYQLLEPLLLNQKETETCVYAMEYFETLASTFKNSQDEIVNKANYLAGDLGSKLVSILLQNLTVVDKDEDDLNGISHSAAKCLQSIFEGEAFAFQKIVLNFVENTIKHQNWKYRQASIRSFATLLIGLPAQRSVQLVNLSLLSLVALVNDSEPAVQLWTIKSLSTISEESAPSFLQHSNFIEILKLILSKIMISEEYIQNIARIVTHLSDYCIQHKLDHFDLYTEDMIKLFFQCAFEVAKEPMTINLCMIAIMRLLSSIRNLAIVNRQLEFILSLCLQINSFRAETKDIYASSLFALVNSCLLLLKKEPMQLPILKGIYDLVTAHYGNINDVSEDVLYVVAALSHFFPNDKTLFNDFWKYIEHSLKKVKEEAALRAAVSCICDFALNIGELISEKMQSIVAEFTSIFANNEFSYQVKMDILQCFGDLSLYCPKTVFPHISSIMGLIITSCEGAVALYSQEKSIAETLFQAIISSLTCLVNGINDSDAKSLEFANYLSAIFEFVRMTTEKNYHPKVDYVRNCMLLLADVVKYYKVESKILLGQPFVKELIFTLQKYNKDGALSGSIQYARNYLA